MRTPLQIKNAITEVELELDRAIKVLKRDARGRIAELEKEMKQASQVAAVEARQQIMAILAEHQLSIETVFGGGVAASKKARAKRGPLPIPTKHYVGPEGQVWGGRGAHPVWIKGKDKKQFERPGAP